MSITSSTEKNTILVYSAFIRLYKTIKYSKTLSNSTFVHSIRNFVAIKLFLFFTNYLRKKNFQNCDKMYRKIFDIQKLQILVKNQ